VSNKIGRPTKTSLFFGDHEKSTDSYPRRIRAAAKIPPFLSVPIRYTGTSMMVRYFAVLSVLLLTAGRASAGVERIRLVWNDSPATTMVVAWDQVSGEDPVVKFDIVDRGEDADAYRFERSPTRVEPYRGMSNHFAKLEDLLPDTAYYFVIHDSEGVSERLWFRTGPSLNVPFTFVAGGDTKTTPDLVDRARWSHRMVAKLRPLFAVFDGDFCSDGASDDAWRLWLSDWSAYSRTSDGRMIPLVPVVGNHEAPDLAVVHKLFDAPYQDNDMSAIYYSLDFGEGLLHLSILNSEVEVGGFQRIWLEHDLSAHNGVQFAAAAYHKAIRPHNTAKSDQDRQYDEWAGLFYDFGVDLAIEADSHLHKITFPIRPTDEVGSAEGYLRDDLFGTVYVGEGSWGAQTRPDDDPKPWTMTSGEFNQIKWVHVYPTVGDDPGRLEIYTIVTGTVDEEGYVEHVSAVGENSEDDPFALPKNITLAGVPNGEPWVTYPLRRELEGYTFQQGVSGYEGAMDIELRQAEAETPFDAEVEATAAASDEETERQVLIRFSDLFGDDAGRVPSSCEVESASLRVWVEEGSEDGVALHDMRCDWSADDTWASLDGGVTPDDEEAAALPAASVEKIEGAGYWWFDVTGSLQSWRAAPDTNHGWVVIGNGNDQLTIYTSEWDSPRHRPKLIVQCKAAEPENADTDTGTAELDTGPLEPAPIEVLRRTPAPNQTPDEPPPEVELPPSPDVEYNAVTSCQCNAVAGAEASLSGLVLGLFGW
jgi:hypothetical protein